MAAVNRTLSNNIPYDVQYGDVDYLNRFKTFTLDQKRFGDLPNYSRLLQSQGMHWIFIVDPAIDVDSTVNPPYR